MSLPVLGVLDPEVGAVFLPVDASHCLSLLSPLPLIGRRVSVKMPSSLLLPSLRSSSFRPPPFRFWTSLHPLLTFSLHRPQGQVQEGRHIPRAEFPPGDGVGPDAQDPGQGGLGVAVPFPPRPDLFGFQASSTSFV